MACRERSWRSLLRLDAPEANRSLPDADCWSYPDADADRPALADAVASRSPEAEAAATAWDAGDRDDRTAIVA